MGCSGSHGERWSVPALLLVATTGSAEPVPAPLLETPSCTMRLCAPVAAGAPALLPRELVMMLALIRLLPLGVTLVLALLTAAAYWRSRRRYLLVWTVVWTLATLYYL